MLTISRGYTGKLTAEYITTHLPTDLKWAVAGRSESKLQTVVDECKRLNSDRTPPGMSWHRQASAISGLEMSILLTRTNELQRLKSLTSMTRT